MPSNTVTTGGQTKATEGATHPNTEGVEVATNHPEVGMSHLEEDTLEQAGEAATRVKQPHHQLNLKEGPTLAKEETTNKMVTKAQANGVQIAKSLPTIQHNAGPRKRLTQWKKNNNKIKNNKIKTTKKILTSQTQSTPST